MKYTLSITQQCNLRCSYCYIRKRDETMSEETARLAVDAIFSHTPEGRKMDIGFFGGEPLMEFGLLRRIVGMIESHPGFGSRQVSMAVVTNGTLFNEEMAGFLREHSIAFCLSTDGPPELQDMHRRYPDGSGSSADVQRTIDLAKRTLPFVLVNAVYGPSTIDRLPEVVEHFIRLGMDQIYLNPDYSARWEHSDALALGDAYMQVADIYIRQYLAGAPRFISLIDAKLTAILKGGYDPMDRCCMGRGEFAVSASGHVYPCERLIGDDSGGMHRLGHISEGFARLSCRAPREGRTLAINSECPECGVAAYCMNWCGCSNHFSTGRYDMASPFQCISERAAISAGFRVFDTLERQRGAEFLGWAINNASVESCGRASQT